MKDITNDFGTLYYPKAAMVVYQSKGRNGTSYIEYFDMDQSGSPINPHPLTVREANRLAKSLKTETEQKELLLKPTGFFDGTVLFTDPLKGEAVWFTTAQRRNLYFTKTLGISNGIASVPPMVWAASRQHLTIYALKSNKRPQSNTKLFYAPFFNVYKSGDVCMGTVDVEIKRTASLEKFITAWETYFFESYFSHLMNQHNPIKGNCVQLWQSLVNSENKFPVEILKQSTKTLKDLIQ